MRKRLLNIYIFILAATLAACGNGKTEYVYYAPVDNTPKLDMRASIYQGTLVSGYKLTITADQVGTAISGAYTIKDGQTIISSGKVSSLVTSLQLTTDGGPCIAEQMSAVPSNITASGADLTLSGTGCTESTIAQNITTTTRISKITQTAAMKLISQGTTNASEVILLNIASADNVNFIGSLTLSNQSISTSASGTLVGKIRNGFLTSSSSVNINDPNAVGFQFDSGSNFSGHFFNANDNITSIGGQIKTAPTLGGQYFISEIIVTVANNGTTQQLGPITNPTTIQSYTLQ